MPLASPPSALLAEVFRALDADWQLERDLTARVAVMAALEYSFSEIAVQLQLSPVQLRGALIRLRRVAPQLIREEMQ